jgi:ribonuclease HII
MASSESVVTEALFNWGDTLICGVDEAGRGPLAGPVYAAAVILNPAKPIAGLRDSKKLTASKRESLLAMRRAIEGLSIRPELALIDGNRCPVCTVRTEAIIKGDDKVAEISAASILAKTARDAALMAMHGLYPQYAFDQHKGYPTALHLERLRLHGATPEHRRSYAPVKAVLADAFT